LIAKRIASAINQPQGGIVRRFSTEELTHVSLEIPSQLTALFLGDGKNVRTT